MSAPGPVTPPPPESSPSAGAVAGYGAAALALAAASRAEASALFDAQVPTVIEDLDQNARRILISALASLVTRRNHAARVLAARSVATRIIAETGIPARPIVTGPSPAADLARLTNAVAVVLDRATEISDHGSPPARSDAGVDAPTPSAPAPRSTPALTGRDEGTRRQTRATPARPAPAVRALPAPARQPLALPAAPVRRAPAATTSSARGGPSVTAFSRRGRPASPPPRRPGAARVLRATGPVARAAPAPVLPASEPDPRHDAQRATVERIAFAEPADAGRAAVLESAEEQNRDLFDEFDAWQAEVNADLAAREEKRSFIFGWTRDTNGEACSKCQAWADGKVRPLGVRMKSHPGCQCIARLVIDSEIDRHDLTVTDAPEPTAGRNRSADGGVDPAAAQSPALAG